MRQARAVLSVRGLILPAIRDFHDHLGSLVFFGIVFGFLHWLVLAPVLAFLFTLAVRWGGDRVVTNEEILAFFLSPAGAVALLVLIATVFTSRMTHQVGMMIVFANLRARRPVGWIRALLAMLAKLPGILLLNAVRAVVLLLVLLPFAGIGALLYFRFLAGYDLNYLVQVRPAAFWWSAAVAALLAVAAGLSVLAAHARFVFAFPAYFFARRSPLGALRQGFRLAKGHTRRLIWVFLVWIGLFWTLGSVLRALIDRVGPVILPWAGGRLGVVVAVLGAALILEASAHGALSLFNYGVKAIAVTRAYVFVSGDDELAIVPRSASKAPYRRRTAWAVAVLAAVYLVGAYVSAAELIRGLDLQDRVRIAAHRGDSRDAPENTLAAVDLAIKDGADYAEIDVQETADGVIVVLHDSDLRRIAGRDDTIRDVTYDEIRELDAGSWFSPEFAGERIPTLAETIALADGRIRLIIEIKLSGHGRNLVESVVRIIEETGFESQCIVASLNRAVLDEVAELNPRLKRGYLAYRTLGDIRRIDADYLMVETRLATLLAVGEAHDAGKKIFVWTVNDVATMSFLIDRGVDGILTDDPAMLAGVLDQRAELTDLELLVLRAAEPGLA